MAVTLDAIFTAATTGLSTLEDGLTTSFNTLGAASDLSITEMLKLQYDMTMLNVSVTGVSGVEKKVGDLYEGVIRNVS